MQEYGFVRENVLLGAVPRGELNAVNEEFRKLGFEAQIPIARSV